MAPQVPYTGVPSVAPQLEPTPRYQVDATPAAFGTNVAAAVEGMGKTVEGAGNEIFARGVAMQDLYNHSESLQADAQYSAQAGQIYEKMKSMQGKEAVDYYTSGAYQKELEDARSKIREGLTNPMAQKMYDSSTLSTFTRTNLYGGSYSGEQNRHYAISSSKARVQAIGDQALAHPGDDIAFNKSLADGDTEIAFQYHGQGDDVIKEAQAQNRSALWGQRVQGLIKDNQPQAASKMFDQAVKDGQIRGEDIGRLRGVVQSATHTVGARIISQQVSSGAGLRWGAGQVDIGQAREAIGQYETGGNYDAIGVQTKHGRALGKYQVMEENLPEFLTKAGLGPMTPEEFLKNHAAQDQVFSTVFGGYMKETGSFNDAASKWFSGKTMVQAGAAKDALGTTVPAYVSATNAILAKNAPLAAKVDMGQQIASEQFPNDPLAPDYVRDRIEVDHNKAVAIDRNDKFQNSNVIETQLMGGQSGKLPTTIEELTADPQAGAAWDWLNQHYPAKARYYLGVLTKNSKGDHAWTNESLKEYQRLYGLAKLEPDKFVEENILDSNIPNAQKAALIRLQQRAYGTSQGDPGIRRALQILQPDLVPAGITLKENRDDYLRFTGALADQIQDFMETNKRPPKVDEVKQIGSHLMQQQHSPEFWFNTSTDMTYRLPVPSEIAANAKKLNPNLTDDQIQREYTRQKYQELYGKSTAAKLVPVR